MSGGRIGRDRGAMATIARAGRRGVGPAWRLDRRCRPRLGRPSAPGMAWNVLEAVRER